MLTTRTWASYRMRVEVSDPDGTGADPDIFVYLRGLPNPYDDAIDDYLQGIAGVADLSEYPVGEPNTHTTYPMYRLAYFELDFRSIHLAQAVWATVLAEAAILLKALDLADTLALTDTVEVG